MMWRTIPVDPRTHCSISTYGNFGEYVEKERDDRVVDPYSLSAEPLPEVLRHGVHSRGHVDGDEKPAQHQDR